MAGEVALYLMTAPGSSVLGLYHLPVPLVVHATGAGLEELELLWALFGEQDFAHYDPAAELVYLPTMARYQLAPSLSAGDKRIPWVRAELARLPAGHRFVADFRERYWRAFHLEAPRKPLSPIGGAPPSPIEAPSSPIDGASTVHRQDIDKTSSLMPHRRGIGPSEGLPAVGAVAGNGGARELAPPGRPPWVVERERMVAAELARLELERPELTGDQRGAMAAELALAKLAAARGAPRPAEASSSPRAQETG
jgi:hypothetical protein